MIALVTLLILQASGPVGKFDDTKPEVDLVSKTSIHDIERCLINTEDRFAPPFVYTQADRPGQVQILWAAGGRTHRRIDLRLVSDGTAIRGWNIGEHARDCW